MKKSKLKFPAANIGKNWVFLPGKPAECWMDALPENGIPFTADGVFNLDRIQSGKLRDECTIYQEIDSPETGTFLLGFAADWWFEVYVNGELCFSAMNENGNFYGAICAEDHTMLVRFHKGKNLLAARIVRGLSSREFECRGISGTPIVAKVLLGPWLCSPDAGSMGIRFLTGLDIAAGVEYRIKGSSAWTVCWHAQCGQLVRSDNHLVELNGLHPETEYEYRITMRAPEDPVTVIRDPKTYSFHTPGILKDKVSFLFTADLQYPPELQRQYIKSMFESADYQTADFFVLGGDIAEFQDIRTELIEGMVQCMIDHGASEKPLVFVRGNHELRGREAWVFHDFFALPNGRTYGIFRFGSTAFLVLDCWEDKPASTKTIYTQYNLDENFLQEEKEYLEDALKWPCWREAKRRIVLAHAAAYSMYSINRWMPDQLQKMTDAWFHGKDPLYKLDLWLSGHTHVHLRTIPKTDIIVSPKCPPLIVRSGENDIYPVLTVGGPGKNFPVQASVYRVDVEQNCIVVKAFNQDGELIDHVIYHDNGPVEEMVPLSHDHLSADGQ